MSDTPDQTDAEEFHIQLPPGVPEVWYHNGKAFPTRPPVLRRGKVKSRSWCLQGVDVGEKVVKAPDTQTIEEILGDDNLERRRIRIERFGWDRFLTEAGGEVIDERSNDIDNTREALIRLVVKDEIYTVLVPTCKTGRVFFLQVPPETQTCEEAQTYLQGDATMEELGIPPMRSIGRS